MKFVCENCKSKYNIADEKVRNKVLKIRCKKCNKIIEVRDPSLSAQAESGAKISAEKSVGPKKTGKKPGGSVLEGQFAASFKRDSKAPMKRRGEDQRGTPGLYGAVVKSAERLDKSDTDLKVWFVAIDETPMGPIAAKSVHKYQQKKRVSDDSLVWKEGMPDWLKLRNCKELVGLLAKLDIEASLSPAEAEPKEEGDKPRLGLFAEKKGKDVESPLKGGSVGVLDERIDAHSEVPEAADAEKAADKIKPEKDWYRDDQSEDFSLGMTSQVASLQSISPIKPKTGADRWVKVAAVGFFAIALIVLGVIVIAPGATSEQQVVEKVVEKFIEVETEKIVYRDRPEMGGKEGPVPEVEKGTSGSGGKKVGGKISGGSKPKVETAEEKKKRLLAQMGMSSGVGDQKLVGGNSGSGDTGSGSGSGGATLSQKQLSGVVNKNKGRLQICYEQSLKKGEAPADSDVKVLLSLKVGGSGMVKKVGIGGSGGKLPGLKSCLQRNVKKWMFPTSSGDSSVEFPFLFTPK